MRVLVTGAAGFIGYHLSELLLNQSVAVIGVDNVNSYYDVALKEARVARLVRPGFTFLRQDIADGDAMMALFEAHRPSHVVHLAAQPGVRYSLENPQAYLKSNVDGFLSILEACRRHPVEHLVFASTSSVYGATAEVLCREERGTEHPLTLYAATKKADEMMAHTYAHLFGIPSTGVRFFTVYGPWGRPDMAPVIFTKAISEGRPIPLFNSGEMQRDFTYVDDIVSGVASLLDRPPAPDPDWTPQEPDPSISGVAPYRILNIGRGRTEPLMRFVSLLEENIGKKAIIEELPMQAGDVKSTSADITKLRELTGFEPSTDIDVGVAKFVAWYKDYYGGA